MRDGGGDGDRCGESDVLGGVESVVGSGLEECEGASNDQAQSDGEGGDLDFSRCEGGDVGIGVFKDDDRSGGEGAILILPTDIGIDDGVEELGALLGVEAFEGEGDEAVFVVDFGGEPLADVDDGGGKSRDFAELFDVGATDGEVEDG